MNKDKYLCIESANMYSINYALLSEIARNKKGGLTAYTGSSCQLLFKKNEIPYDLQKIFVTLVSLKSPLNKKMYGGEYLTNVPIRLFKNAYYEHTVSGVMFGAYPGFRFTNSSYCNEKEIIEFMSSLKQMGLLNNYLKCLGEIFQINIKTNENLIEKAKYTYNEIERIKEMNKIR